MPVSEVHGLPIRLMRKLQIGAKTIMKQKTTIIESIGAFEITPDEIKDLSVRIQGISGQGELALDGISVQMKDTEYSYASCEELREEHPWNSKIAKFSLHFCGKKEEGAFSYSSDSQKINIYGGTAMDNTIIISSNNPAWAHGARNLVRDEMKNFEFWYSRLTVPLLPIVLFWIFMFLGLAYLLNVMITIFLENLDYSLFASGWISKSSPTIVSLLATPGAFYLVGGLSRSRLKKDKSSKLINRPNIVLSCTVLMAALAVLREVARIWP